VRVFDVMHEQLLARVRPAHALPAEEGSRRRRPSIAAAKPKTASRR
jgi:hypothetical protein